MKKFSLVLLVIAVFAGGMVPSPARARVSFDFFYEALEPYGSWIEVADYGYCWRPARVDEGWAPYTDGYWAYTTAGWTWVSYEDWGAITYHYGRWIEIEEEGWCWVPDDEWGPAWVSWRYSDEHVGWAPLPPRARFTATVGFSSWVDREYDIGPRHYNFCRVRDFGAPALRPVIIDRSRNVTIITNTVNITNITVHRETNIVYNGGPRYEVISRRSERPIQTLRLVQQREVDVSDRRVNRLLARQEGNQLIVAAPQFERTERRFKPSRVERVVSQAKVRTGWSGIENPERLRTKIREEVKVARPEDAPAKPVDPAELKIVEEKTSQPQPQPPAAGQTPAIEQTPVTAGQTPSPSPAGIAAPPPADLSEEKGEGKTEDRKGRKARRSQAGDTPAQQQTPASPLGSESPATLAPPTAGSTPETEGKKKRKALENVPKPSAEQTPVTVPPDQSVTPPEDRSEKTKRLKQKAAEGDTPAQEKARQQNSERDAALEQQRKASQEVEEQRRALQRQQNQDAAAARQRAVEQQQQQPKQQQQLEKRREASEPSAPPRKKRQIDPAAAEEQEGERVRPESRPARQQDVPSLQPPVPPVAPPPQQVQPRATPEGVVAPPAEGEGRKKRDRGER